MNTQSKSKGKNQRVKSHSKACAYTAYKQSIPHYITDGDKTSLVIDHDLTAVTRLYQIDDAVKAFLKSSNKVCSIEHDDKSHLRRINMSTQGKTLHLCFTLPIDDITSYFPTHTFSPHIDIFIKAMRRHKLDQMPTPNWRALRGQDVDFWSLAMNDFGDDMRAEVKTTEFKALIRSKQRVSNENFKALMDYFQALFKKNGKILALRIDTGYSKTSNFDEAGIDVPYEKAKLDRQAFIDEVRKRFKDTLLGYAWKFEYGRLKGYHNHFLILLNGSKVRQDMTIGKILGDHWNTAITEGRGVYYNCNNSKDSYRYCGIGMLNHQDPSIWEGLEKIAVYMTKTDYLVRLNMPGNDRSFGKGVMPKETPKKRGRPRII